MTKRRVTVSLDEDLISAVQAMAADRSLSAVVNDVLRQAVVEEADRAAMLRWLDELDERYGAATPAEIEAADSFLDAFEAGVGPPSTSAA